MRAALAPLLIAASTHALAARRITAKMSAQGVLLTKAGKDGVAQGDCPFTQYAAMSMQLAGASYKLRPTPQEEKPAWHLDAHGGSMPCWAPNGFEDGADAIADSGGIAKHFLTPSATDAAVMENCGGLFKGIAMLLKNTDDAKDDDAATANVTMIDTSAHTEQLQKLTSKELKDVCKRNKLSTSGSKVQIIERLVDHGCFEDVILAV